MVNQMTRRAFPLAVALLCLYLATASPVLGQGAEIERVAPELASRIAAADRTTIAVADFTDLQGRVTELGRFLAEELSVALVNTNEGLKVIDRGHIRTLLAEHQLAQQGIIDQATAAELGRIAGVDALIAGTVTELEDVVQVSIKALDTDSATILAASIVTVMKSPAMIILLRRDIQGGAAGGSGQSPPGSRRATDVPDVRAWQNDFLIVTVDSAGVSEDGRHVSLALTFENKTSTDQLVACTRGSAGLMNGRATNWRIGQLAGLSTTTFSTPGRQDAFTRLSPGAKLAVVVRFNAVGEVEAPPSMVSFSMLCWRKVGSKDQQFSVGLSRIPIGQ